MIIWVFYACHRKACSDGWLLQNIAWKFIHFIWQYLILQFTVHNPWWHHQIETFSALLAHCAGNSPVTGEFPAQRPVTRSFWCFFFICAWKKRLSKQSWGWGCETPRSSWRHRNADFVRLVSFLWDSLSNILLITTPLHGRTFRIIAHSCGDPHTKASYAELWQLVSC